MAAAKNVAGRAKPTTQKTKSKGSDSSSDELEKSNASSTDDETPLIDPKKSAKGKKAALPEEQDAQDELPLAMATLPHSVVVDSGVGPWEWYLKHKGHSSTLQRYLVPWLIALHGIGFSKIKKAQTQIAEMVVALCTEHNLLRGATTLSPAQAAEMFPVAFGDVCNKSREAASKPTLLECIMYPIVSP